ncbi:MAG: helix-turn-helix transcriptional regulator [Microthrixaceae bacterium]
MSRHFMGSTTDALRTLGGQIGIARRRQRRTAADVAERAGISAPTLRRVERGDPGVAIGIVFEVASVLGVPLFGASGRELAELAARGERELALLPARIDEPTSDFDNDF